MFTGIVECVGRVASIESGPAGAVLWVEAPGIGSALALGASVAVDGVCLTVTQVDGERLRFDAVPETLERTALGDRRAGDAVNLERALRADGRFEGHIVQGHVDGTGRVESLEPEGEGVRLRIACAPEALAEMVPKGSIAVDGVSLTLAALDEHGFEIALVPHTLRHTTLGRRTPGARVNLEFDVIGKYVRRLLAQSAAQGGIR